MNETVLFAFLLTFLAGISTSIGAILAFFIKKENLSALALGLGFSAGVMIYVSFIEILDKSEKALSHMISGNYAAWITVLMFFAGIILAAGIDRLIPHHIEHEMLEEVDEHKIKAGKLQRMGLFTALALAIHNFPEGLATFMAGLTNVTLGVSIAFAIALHNIPEGISVALPIYHATDSRKKAFIVSTLSGMAEPVGAFLGYLLFRSFFNDFTFGLLFALVAGIMVYISLDELLPTAREYGQGHLEILGVTAGMFVMAISLLLFK